jgi:hypothetical protein
VNVEISTPAARQRGSLPPALKGIWRRQSEAMTYVALVTALWLRKLSLVEEAINDKRLQRCRRPK